MHPFNEYARYYNLLYQDKPYFQEVHYLLSLFERFESKPKTLLDMGCGTGQHGVHFANEGLCVHGIDKSAQMLEIAGKQLLALPQDQRARLSFSQGDIGQFSFDERLEPHSFDGAVSLFHVMSYQTTNSQLRSAFQCAQQFIKPGGLFIFDVWYGPAVLGDKPQGRIKCFENEDLKVTRVADPKMALHDNTVHVDYDILIQDKLKETLQHINERHSMRYVFAPEVELLCDQFSMQCLGAFKWLTVEPLDENAFSACFVLKT